ncbi:MAG: GAF domain-containing protein [Thermoleophilia bacterium]|nr:GAF domain-containing protein [Thermoleophilia bacterium]
MNRAGSRISAAAAATALECLEDLCILAYRPAPERELHSAIAEMTSTITGWESAALVHADADRTRTLAAVGDRTMFGELDLQAIPEPMSAHEVDGPNGSVIGACRLGDRDGLLLVGVIPDPPLDDEGGRVLVTCAHVARQALRMGHTQRAAREARTTTQRLVDAGISLSSQTTLKEVLGRMVGVARDVLHARYAAIAVLSPDHREMEQFVTSGLGEEQVEQIGAPPRGRGLLGALIKNPQPVRIGDIRSHPESCGFPPGHPEMQSFLGIPVTLRDEVFGILYVTEKIDEAEFSDADLRLGQTLASQAAVAVDNARRYQAERQRVAELNSLQEVSTAMHGTLELEELLPLIARHARTLTGADRVSISIRGVEKAGIEVSVGDEVSERIPPELLVPTGGAHAVRTPGHHWLVVEPLNIGGDPIGTLTAISRIEFEARSARLLSTLAGQASLAVANAETFASERERLRESARIAAADARASAAADGLRKAIQLQETERARVARELHDEAGQSLTALALNMRALEGHVDDVGRRELTRLRQMVNTVSADLRTIATDLRPSGLREHGLASAIQRQAERLKDASGISVDLALDELPDDLPEQWQIAVYRVVQEALTNVARHSNATHVSVLAHHRLGYLRVMVEDDGCGFDPTASTDRLGLQGMRERAELLGGTLRIESTIGAGTAVLVDLEVDDE